MIFEQFLFVSSASAQALPITPDGTTSTSITQTASGIDQVNIATPNSSGLSHNNFTDYNINQSGQVINNFSGQVASEVAGGSGTSAVTSTQIGGLVTVNQNLSNSGSARIILNEVTSGNNTQLLGYGEIAGTKAELIIANPNGITCSGCGFINTSRLSLVAGSSNFDQNNNLGFNLTEQTNPNLTIPLITISGLGLDVERTSATDIIASSIKLIGNIYGSDDTDVTLKTGEGRYDYNSKNLTTHDSQLTTNVELFAVDASNLGSIQSGRIFIIATKDGFGVNLNNSLIASKELNIDTKGNLYYANISSPTITINSTKNITQKADSTTLANSIDITSNQDFTINSNALLKSLTTDININAQNFTNLGNVLATNNLTISLSSNLTNQAILNAKEKIAISAIGNITNETSGIIGSFSVTDNDDSTTDSLTKEVGITVQSLTNKNLIYATNSLSITGKVNNSKSLISDKALTITSSNTSNSGNIISFNDKVIINTDVLNNQSLIYGPDIEIDLGENDLTTSGVFTSNNLTISARNITNDINLEAINSLTFNASNKITNNSNKKLISGNLLELSAQNLIENFGTISSEVDLTLTSNYGNITNYSNIEGGKGNLTINALSGKFTNDANAIISNDSDVEIANGDGTKTAIADNSIKTLTINSKNLENLGEISAKGNLAANISNNLSNKSGALIWSGNSAVFNVSNQFINEISEIYAQKNLTIQKNNLSDKSLNKVSEINNLSGNITALTGDMLIKADKFYNGRKDGEVALSIVWDENYRVCDSTKGLCQYGEYRMPVEVKLENHNLLNWVYLGSNNNGGANYAYAAKRKDNGDVRTIFAGKTLTIESNSFTNEVANIFSKEAMNISFSNDFSNISKTLPGIFFSDSYGWGPCGGQYGACNKYWINYVEGTDFYSTYNAYIKSLSSLTITQNGNSRADLINGNLVDDFASQIDSADSKSHTTTFSQTDIDNLKSYGEVNVNISKFFDSNSSFFGSIKKSANQNAPVLEARGIFINIEEFYGSDYLFIKLGISKADFLRNLERFSQKNNSNNMRFLGDSYVESELLKNVLSTLRKDSLLLSDDGDDANQEIKILLDNTVTEITRLNLNINQVALNGLTNAQTNSLQKDIITFEAQNIGGVLTLVPKIYLTLDTRNKLLGDGGSFAGGSTIFSKDSLTISSPLADLRNNGSIISNKDMNLTVNSFTNKTNSLVKGLVGAKNNLTIAATNDIKNIGANINASGNLSLASAQGNILNTSIVQTNDANLLASSADSYQLKSGDSARSSGNISSSLLETASLKGGSINISAAKDFTNLAAGISASGDVAVAAGDDINISTLQLRNRTETSWGGKKKGGISITDNTTNIQSDVNSEGSISLSSNGNANITAANFTSADDINIQAKDDVVIQSAQNSNYSFSAGRVGKGKSFLNSSDSISQLSSNLTTTNNGNITINSGVDNLDLIGSNAAQGSISLIASNLVTKDIDNNADNNLGSGDISLTAKEDINVVSALNYLRTETLSGKKTSWIKKSHGEVDTQLTNVSSNIIASGDVSAATNSGNINLASGDDTTITASNLSGNNGNITTGKYIDPSDSNNIAYNQDGQLTIQSGQDFHLHVTTDMHIKKDAGAVVVGAVAAVAAVVLAAPTGGASLMLLGGAAAGGGMVGANSERGRTLTNITEETTQKISTLSFKNDLNIQSASDTTIIASTLNANNAKILTGKIEDADSGAKTTINENAELKINSAFNTRSDISIVKQVKPNYAGVALVAGVSAYSGFLAGEAAFDSTILATNSNLLANAAWSVGGSAGSNAVSTPASHMDPLFNLRSKHIYSSSNQNEVKTNLNFNNLITQ